ncbi:indolepyruvate ferredoxin oxidoreductase family protein [Pseudonocardia sp. N23]|uniref:indolepyruvate ferredoxin oxidoreductase family protein n=1 Tax=Pseudonocardia sp. N23 TaxID=1987376 RepID=UPI000BFD150E|nr:indolepyruvate ferredoxin oxidoreductase family protein [Pseudonocardia sp. N23]GAY11010.1 indolepyruvate ferredoxin oxidoreductase, alpha and beta subunits [Pseudonocardia sp. N23]
MTVPERALETLAERYTRDSGTLHLTGTQALVRLLLDIRRVDQAMSRNTAVFVSGYEGSPLAGYDLEIARAAQILGSHNVSHQSGLNEDLAATAIEGTQIASGASDARYDGVVGVWYGKAPGLDRATDAIRHANFAGTHPNGGVLALVGDDAISKSSTLPSSSEAALADLLVPTLSPADSQEIIDLGLHGVSMSRASGLWVALKLFTNVAEGASTLDLPDYDDLAERLSNSESLNLYSHTINARSVGDVPVANEVTAVHQRLAVVKAYSREFGLNRVLFEGRNDRVGIICAGKTYHDTRHALASLGIDEAGITDSGIRLLKLGLVFPIDRDEIRQFAHGLSKIIVVEEKRAFIETEIKSALYGSDTQPSVLGKTDTTGRELFAPVGELDPDAIAVGLARVLQDSVSLPLLSAFRDRKSRMRGRIALDLIPRTPYFCSGCPHNRSTKVPEGSLVGAGIGCHGMVIGMDESIVGDVFGLAQMGAEGIHWLGMSPYVGRSHLIQNMGDGTFSHSGSLAIRAAIAAGVSVTYKILYNSAVAMTGGQRAVGQMPIRELTEMLTAEGVERIIVTADDMTRYGRKRRLGPRVEVWHRDRLPEAHEALRETAGVTVLIHDQECAAEKRRKRKRGLLNDPPTRVFINERVCEGCGDCGVKSNCLSVQPVDTEFGRKTQIHQQSCNKDYSCLDGDCPSFVTVLPGNVAARRPAGTIESSDLPEPLNRATDGEFTVRISGVGGTGVVTVAQIIAMAGYLAGRYVRGLDQTGVAQKGGAVVSDLRISPRPVAAPNKLANAECDLYLACDVLVGSEPKNREVMNSTRTAVVVSTDAVPTGQMIVDTATQFPSVDGMVSGLFSDARADAALSVDARSVTRLLYGDDQLANIFLLGCAYQIGALPVSAAYIERAIVLNGAMKESNIQAFRRGRQYVADPGAIESEISSLNGAVPTRELPADPVVDEIAKLVSCSADSELGLSVSRRVRELLAYQDKAYAIRYASLVETVRTSESGAMDPDESTLSIAVAQHLYKLMAYKDEYEVARLLLDSDADQRLRSEFGDDVKYKWNLHPPALRALGMKRKIRLGSWARPALRVLRASHMLRGSRLDVFGYAAVRRLERSLRDRYIADLHLIAANLTRENHSVAVEIATLPDMVRGYEEVKIQNANTYLEKADKLVEVFSPAAAQR